jgi:hypothetical protein
MIYYVSAYPPVYFIYIYIYQRIYQRLEQADFGIDGGPGTNPPKTLRDNYVKSKKE